MFHSSITIDAPPEAVFDELSHVERHPAWANPKADMTMEQVAGEGPGPDAKYRSTGIFTKSRVSADLAVTSYRPSTAFTIRLIQHQEGKKDAWYQHDVHADAAGLRHASGEGDRREHQSRRPGARRAGDQEGRDDLADQPEAPARVPLSSPSSFNLADEGLGVPRWVARSHDDPDDRRNPCPGVRPGTGALCRMSWRRDGRGRRSVLLRMRTVTSVEIGGFGRAPGAVRRLVARPGAGNDRPASSPTASLAGDGSPSGHSGPGYLCGRFASELGPHDLARSHRPIAPPVRDRGDQRQPVPRSGAARSRRHRRRDR